MDQLLTKVNQSMKMFKLTFIFIIKQIIINKGNNYQESTREKKFPLQKQEIGRQLTKIKPVFLELIIYMVYTSSALCV